MGYSIRTDRCRYTIWYAWTDRRTDISKPLAEELYDYAADPLETANLAAQTSYSTALSDMRALFERYKQERIR